MPSGRTIKPLAKKRRSTHSSRSGSGPSDNFTRIIGPVIDEARPFQALPLAKTEITETDKALVFKAELSGFDPRTITVEIEDQTLILLIAERISRSQSSQTVNGIVIRERRRTFRLPFSLPNADRLDFQKRKKTFDTGTGLLTITIPRVIEPPPPRDGATVAEDDDRIITKQGTRYFPVSLAAERAQVPRTTLLDWIKNKQFAGRPLETYNSPTAHKAFLSDESVHRLVNRFVKWNPEKKKPAGPAGAVTIGETRDQTGYIGLPKAARQIGVDYNTLRLWATQGKEPPVNKTLDVIQDTASQQFYIRQTDVAELKRLIPKRGLQRGRRPQPAS